MIKLQNYALLFLKQDHQYYHYVNTLANNLTDQHYPAALNSGLYFPGTPRQYGIKVRKTF